MTITIHSWNCSLLVSYVAIGDLTALYGHTLFQVQGDAWPTM